MQEVKYKVPKIELSKKVYGIHFTISDGGLNMDEGGNNLVYSFFIKRKGIIKRWSAIKDNLPNLGDINISHEFIRNIRKDTSKIYDSSSLSGIISSDDITFKDKLSKMPGHPYLKHKKTYLNLVDEYVYVVVKKPMLFSTDFRSEFIRILKLRDFIYAENTRLSAVDKISALMGGPVIPEYEEDKLTIMKLKHDSHCKTSGHIGDFNWL